MRPRLLDLFCCAGGAARGYWLAGFEVTGVDIAPQELYGGNHWIQGDALEILADRDLMAGFDAVHASPPCQHYSTLNAYNKRAYPDLIAPVRELLGATGLPYIIENVPQAPLIDPVMLCGTMFGLPIYRHRDFESNIRLTAPAHARHARLCARAGYLPTAERPYMSIHGSKHSKAWLFAAAEAMGVTWMVDADTASSHRRVCESIPPAYTRHLGSQLLAAVGARLGVAST